MENERTYSDHQRRIIRHYYADADGRSLEGLRTIVTDMFLAASEKKLNQLWDRAEKNLRTLKFKESLITHIVATRDPKILAAHLERIERRT